MDYKLVGFKFNAVDLNLGYSHIVALPKNGVFAKKNYIRNCLQMLHNSLCFVLLKSN